MRSQERSKASKKALSFPRDDPTMPLWINNDVTNGELSMTMVECFPNGDRLSELIKLYLIAYIVGMLSRYFPSNSPWKKSVR